MGFEFLKKQSNKEDDLQTQLEKAGGIETPLGRIIGNKIDELELEKLKSNFAYRNAVDLNKEKEENVKKAEKKEEQKTEKQSENVFFEDFDSLTYEEKAERIKQAKVRLNEIFTGSVNGIIKKIELGNNDLKIKKKDFDYHFDDDNFLIIDEFNPSLKSGTGKGSKNISQKIIEQVVTLNPNLLGLDLRKNIFGDFSRLSSNLEKTLKINKYIKKIKVDLTGIDEEDFENFEKVIDGSSFLQNLDIQANRLDEKVLNKIVEKCKKDSRWNIINVLSATNKKQNPNDKKVELSKLSSVLGQIKEVKIGEIEELKDFEVIQSRLAPFEFARFLFEQKLNSLKSEAEKQQYTEYVKEIMRLPRKERREFYVDLIKEAFTGIAVHKKADLDAKGILFLSKIAGLNFSNFNSELEAGSVSYLDNSVKYINEDESINNDVLNNLPKSLVADLSQTEGLNTYKTKGPRYLSKYFMATLDHHDPESQKGNSATKQMFELLSKLGLIKDLDDEKTIFVEEIVKFITREDDKIYKFEDYGDFEMSSKNFEEASKTLYGYMRLMQPNNLEKIYNCESLRKKFLDNNPRIPLEFIELSNEELKELELLGFEKNINEENLKLKKGINSYLQDKTRTNTREINSNKFGKVFIQKDCGFIKDPVDFLICNGYNMHINYSNKEKDKIFKISFYGENYPNFSNELIEELTSKEVGVIKVRGMLIKPNKTLEVSEELFNKILKEIEQEDSFEEINDPYLDNSEGQVDFLNDKEALEEYSKSCLDQISKHSFNEKFKNLSNRLKDVSENVTSFRENIQTFMFLSNSESFEPYAFLEVEGKKFYFSKILKEESQDDVILCYVNDGESIYPRLFSASEIGIGNFRSYIFKNKGYTGKELLSRKDNETVELIDSGETQITKLHEEIIQKIKEIKSKEDIVEIDTELGEFIASNFSLVEDKKQNPYSINSYTIEKETKIEATNSIIDFKSSSGDQIMTYWVNKVKEIGVIKVFEELKNNIFNIFNFDKLQCPEGLIPNFQSDFISRDIFDDLSFGKIVSEKFSAMLENKPVEIVYMTNKNGKTWIDEIKYKDSEITTYGTNKNLIMSGVLTSLPLVKKEGNITMHLLGYINGIIKNTCDESTVEEFKKFAISVLREVNYKEGSDYIDITKFLENIDLIKEYKKSERYNKIIEFLKDKDSENTSSDLTIGDVETILESV